MHSSFRVGPAETGASDGDYEEPYVIARYRVLLSEPEYKRILAHMRYKQGHSPLTALSDSLKDLEAFSASDDSGSSAGPR